MGGIFYLLGVVVAVYTGYFDYAWYFIFVSSFIMTVGYFIIRAPHLNGIVEENGAKAIVLLLLIQIATLAIITAPVYFVASLMG